MVKAAYSSGHPALGVGPGNAPVYIEKTANLEIAIPEVIASKTFDNGTICSSDQSVIFDDSEVAEKALRLFEEKGAYLCNEKEKAKLEAVMFDYAPSLVPFRRTVRFTLVFPFCRPEFTPIRPRPLPHLSFQESS